LIKKIKGLRWWVISLIALATVINYIDRFSLALMWPNIANDLGISLDDAKHQYAIIANSFIIAYALGQLISGRLYDYVGARIGFVLSTVVWSVATGIHAFGQSVMHLAIFRSVLGVSEAGPWPGSVKSNAEWFPIKERAMAQGIFNAGASFGAVISAPLIAFLYLTFDWRLTFAIIALLGFLWVIPWLYINRNTPDKHPWITDEERNYILEGQRTANVGNTPDTEAKPLSILELLTYRQTWSIVVARFFIDPVWWMFLNWMPIYLFQVFNYDIKEIGASAWLPYVGAAAGSLLGGYISGNFIKQGRTLTYARKMSVGIGAIITIPGLILTALQSDPWLAIYSMTLALFGVQFALNTIQTLPGDFYAGKSVGTVAGIGGMAAALGVFVSTLIIPHITEVNFFYFFLMGIGLMIVGVILLYFLAGEIGRVKLTHHKIRVKS